MICKAREYKRAQVGLERCAPYLLSLCPRLAESKYRPQTYVPACVRSCRGDTTSIVALDEDQIYLYTRIPWRP